MGKYYDVRDPIHGFITLDEWERDIVNHTVFQRLRGIRQLGLTDMVYPGAMHNRFEHSLGVMHVATRMFDEIVKRRKEFLKNALNFTEGGLERDRVLVRISCLLHDVGHSPFSHAAENLMPLVSGSDKHYDHENYSAAAVLHLMKDVIENHPLNQNYKLTVKEISDFLNGHSNTGRCLLWRDLLTGHLDADRADYLLRDSYHIGVAYGHFDLNRLMITMTVAIDPETESPTLAVEEGGMHTAEALILARYMMFTQVYFHTTRRAYDTHLEAAIKTMLEEEHKDLDLPEKGVFLPPVNENNIFDYMKWNDWKVLGLIDSDNGGDGGKKIKNRDHDRCVHQTSETPDETELSFFEEVFSKLKEYSPILDKAEKSWYKLDATAKDITILLRPGRGDEELSKLSRLSSTVRGLKSVNQNRIYVSYENKEKAIKIVEGLRKNHEGEK